jgi:DinB superfamily
MSPVTTNPYAKYLGEANPQTTIAATPQRLGDLIKNLQPGQLTKSPAPGKWSIRDILCHLADCEIAFAFRLRQAIAETNHVIQPFDQEKWAGPYAHFDAASALTVFSALRDWNRKLIATVPPEGYAKPLIHPERGEMTFRTVVETMGGHDLNHIEQIESLISGRI